MTRRHSTIRQAAAAAMIGTAAALLPAAAVQAQNAPLEIAKQGYFFVGGAIDPKREGSPMVGHMYVEYQVPQRLAHPYPVVMIHGGSQTGTNFTGTPDGRDGWAQYFLRRGYAVYVVDQVARGRAAQWSQANGPVSAANISRLEQRFVAPERFNLWPQARLHTQWPGTGKPGDPSFDQFYASQFPSLVDFPLQQALNRDATVALLDRIGPAVVLIHSQSGRLRLADRRQAAEPRQGDRRGRAQRAARPRRRIQRCAGLVRGQSRTPRRPASKTCRSPTIRR